MPEPAGDGDLWFRCFNPISAPVLRLVCLPHVGGSAGFFLPLSVAMRPRIEVLAVQYPGRQDRRSEAPLTDINQLADGVVAALGDRLKDPLPLAFFGHSMGALVAFEAAQRLELYSDIGISMVVASGRRAPSISRAEHVEMPFGPEGGFDSIDSLLKYLGKREMSKHRSAADQEVAEREVLHSILPAMRADYLAVDSYVHSQGPALSCPITAFVGDWDPHVQLWEAQAWKEHTTGGFELHVFPGDHFYLTSIPAIVFGRLAEVLEVIIE